VRPTAHGAINETHWQDGRSITLEGEIMSTVSISDALAEFRLVTAPMVQTWDVGSALLKWTEDTAGNALQMLVKLDGEVEPVLSEGAASLAYQAHFFAEDPRAYDQSRTTTVGAVLSAASGGAVFPAVFPVQFATSGGGTSSPVNSGNRPTPPVFRIYGACVNPQIVNLTTGQRLVFNGSVAVGDYLEIDVQARTVMRNGTTPLQNFYDPVNSTWFELAVGTSNLQLVASDFDGVARLDTLYRNAWA